ncbi:Fic family protein [Olsenella sp. SW781]|uniref:Fic family protein n=1 Tax=Olsenella sp. SW781 TaxID=2530046 RepID=UPI00143BF1E6|nr:Fic family protein [Olsenella sp. SW781]NJE81033.1 Fic family protein [Olsenella sp. SW781]
MAYRTLAKLFHMDSSSKRYEKNEALAATRLEAESTFRTGVETPHGELFLAVPRELSVLNETILRRERQIALLLSRLPPIATGALIRSLVIDEVVCSNELEGVHSTRRQINDLLETTSADPSKLEHKRFRELARLYLELSDHEHIFPQTPEDIRTIYDRIMEGEDLGKDAPDGILFRKGEVNIIGSGSRIIHTGLSPESRIVSAMTRMIALASSEDIPETCGAIVSHFLFEYAHPFYDGNGRTGRYLLALYLSRPLSTLTALSVSRSIAESRGAYYRAFREVEDPLNHGELTPFVLAMLEYVDTAQHRVLSDLETRQGQFEVTVTAIDELVNSIDLPDKERDVLFMLAQYALFGAFPDVLLRDVAEYLNLRESMARRHTKRLEEKGLVKTVSARPLRFVLTDKAKELLKIPEKDL